jgi:hypothetical protein
VSFHAVLIPAVSLLVLVLPGAVLGLLAGLRPGTAVVVAPVITYGVITTAATVASYLTFTWNALTLLVATAIVAVLIIAIRLATRRELPWRERLRVQRPRRPGRQDWVAAAGVVGGGALAAGVLLAGFGRFGAPNQDWDYIFHANAVRLIADSGDIAPEAMRRINDWESTTFYYPNTFHALAAVVRQLTGASVFEVLNGQAMLVCLIAGLGLAGLLRRLGAPITVVAATPVLLAGFGSFPYDVLWRGPLLPYAAGVAAIPAFALLLDLALTPRRLPLAILSGIGAAGLLGLHPSTALSAGLFVLVYLGFRWIASPRAIGRDLVVLLLVGITAILAAAPAVRGAILTGTSGADQDWPAVESPGQAVGDMLFLNHGGPAPQYWLAGLLVVGILTLHRARYLWWWMGGTAIAFALFVMAAASDATLVQDLTRPWWNDRWRFAALVILGFAPLAALGLHSLARLGAGVLPRIMRGRPRGISRPALVNALVLLGLVAIAVLSRGLYAPSNEVRMAQNYQQERTLSQTEVAAMLWLRDHSTGGTIMNDSNDGSAYLSAVAGLHPLFGHVVNPPLIPRMGPTQQLLLEHFNCLDSDADVRRAIRTLDIRYVFEGSGYVRDFFHRVPGLVGISSSPSLRLVHSAPGVRIYEVALTEAPGPAVSACTLHDSAPRGATG